MTSLKDVVDALPSSLLTALRRACRWITDVAQVKKDQLTFERNIHGFRYASWRGAIRGEYSAATRAWDFFCPVWHTGQAVKALLLAHKVLEDDTLVDAARAGADFILHQQVTQGDDAGLILAYEDLPSIACTSAILESLDGVYLLSHTVDEPHYAEAASAAMAWCRDRAWVRGQGLVRDFYDHRLGQFRDGVVKTKDGVAGRPLADDAMWLRAFGETGDKSFRAVAYEIFERLLLDERPAGNWIDYGPCIPETGEIHPRHAYWWGLPMIAAWQDSHDVRYLDAALRAGAWYVKAQRVDGGLFRSTDIQFKTTSFGHATSGILCAVILWLKLYQETGDSIWLEPMHRALVHGLSMQFTNPSDPNLRGCILEKVLPPDGTDRSPYYIRDLGTIFFVQAAALVLALQPELNGRAEDVVKARVVL